MTRKNLTRALIAGMSTQELALELAKRGIPTEPSRLLGKTTCPRCGHVGPIERDFGFRLMRGELWPQSWCRNCRSAEAKASRRRKR